jgi:hypothetical protein
MRWLKPMIDIIPWIIQDKIHRAITEGSARGVEAILGNRVGGFFGRFPVLGVELESIVA